MGLVSGFIISLWVGIGSQIYPPLPERTKPLYLSIAGCNISSGNITSTEIPLTTVFSTPAAERYTSSSNIVQQSMYFFLSNTNICRVFGLLELSFSGLPTTLFEMQQFSYQTKVCLSYPGAEVKVNPLIDLKSFSSIFEFKGLDMPYCGPQF